MPESFSTTHEKVQFYWQEGCKIAREQKDYIAAIALIIKALNIVKKSTVCDSNYKYSRNYQFYRQLTLLALKAELPEDALKYAKLCNRPDFIADAYFENNQFEKCLSYYMALTEPYTIFPGWTWSPSDNLSRNRLPKVAKSFFHLINNFPEKYNLHKIQENYGWLYNQVISRFGSLEDAFSYYRIYEKQSSVKKGRKKRLKNGKGNTGKMKAQEILKSHRSFKKYYFNKIAQLSVLLNQGALKQAKTEMVKLYERYKDLESETGSKVIGNGKVINLPVEYADLITDITEIFLLNQEFDKALSWTYKHVDVHWRYFDYYINLKYLLYIDLTGKDLIRMGFSSTFCRNIGSVMCQQFYRPSIFAKRNIEDMINRCEGRLSTHIKGLDNSYLSYLNAKYINRKLFRERCRPGPSLYCHVHELFGGKYRKYNLDHDITFQSIEDKKNINPEAQDGIEKNWVHIAFSTCHELVQLISDLCTNCENELRREKGIPEIGCQWKSETEIYAIIKELLANYEVIRHHSPTWLAPMHLDVYVPELSLAIEYQGQQHYMPVDIFGGEEGFKKTKVRDTIKKKLCQQNKVYLLCISYDDEEPEKTIGDFIKKKLRLMIN